MIQTILLIWLLLGTLTIFAVKLFYRKENGFLPRLSELPILILFILIWPLVWYYEITDGR